MSHTYNACILSLHVAHIFVHTWSHCVGYSMRGKGITWFTSLSIDALLEVVVLRFAKWMFVKKDLNHVPLDGILFNWEGCLGCGLRKERILKSGLLVCQSLMWMELPKVNHVQRALGGNPSHWGGWCLSEHGWWKFWRPLGFTPLPTLMDLLSIVIRLIILWMPPMLSRSWKFSSISNRQKCWLRVSKWPLIILGGLLIA